MMYSLESTELGSVSSDSFAIYIFLPQPKEPKKYTASLHEKLKKVNLMALDRKASL